VTHAPRPPSPRSARAKTLVLLTGPVGAGKSTTAIAVTKELHAQGIGAAYIDLDQLYCMARQRDGFGDEAIWHVARRGAGELSDLFFATVADVVVADGEFFSQRERSQLLEAMQTDARVVAVTLKVNFDNVLARVSNDPDPGRVASRIPAILRRLHAAYESAMPFLDVHSRCIETDGARFDEVVGKVVALLLAKPELVSE
jgi:shikimate kinase